MNASHPNCANDSTLLFETYISKAENLQWDEISGWYTYPFISGDPLPLVGEIHTFNNAQARITLINDQLYLYQVSQTNPLQYGTPRAFFDGTTLLFCTVGPNPGHFLSEVISFAEFYANIGCPVRVAIPQTIEERLPLMYQILKGLCPGIRIIPLVDSTSYGFERLVTRRNRWFTFLKTWQDITYTQTNNILRFANLQSILTSHSEPLERIQNYAAIISADNCHVVNGPKKIFVVKTSVDANLISRNRGLFIDSKARSLAENNDFKFISVTGFKDHVEYLCTLRAATHVIFSYGAVTCSNRFFLNPDAVIVLLANKSYSGEYTIGDTHWHIRHSHLCPVRSQSVILDFPDIVDESAMQIALAEMNFIERP